MGKRLDIKSGERFSRLTIIMEVEPKNNHRHFLCLCDCGNQKVIDIAKLRNGHTKSCGCLSIESTVQRSVKHKLYSHPLYRVWNSMKQRCSNSNVKSFYRYGGRGITVCEAWKDNFKNFYDWAMENGYEEGLSLDRINNDADYEPSNCRWVTIERQSNNRSNNRYISYEGKTMTLAEWGRETGINTIVIAKRLKRGWNVAKTLTTPLQTRSVYCEN